MQTEYSTGALANMWAEFYHSFKREDEVITTAKGKRFKKNETSGGHYLRVITEMPHNSELTLVIDYDDLTRANQTDILTNLDKDVDFSLAAAKEGMLQVMHDLGDIYRSYAVDLKNDLHIAIINPPLHIDIPEINHHMLLKIVTFDGIVNATDERTRFMFIKSYLECSECGKGSELQGRPNPSRVYKCDNCKVNLRVNMKKSIGRTYQAIKVQERPDTTMEGRVARDVEVHVTNQEYLNMVKNGDYVTVTGIVRIEYDRISRAPVYDFYIDALHVELKHEDFMAEYDPVLAEEVQSAVTLKTEDADFEKLWRSVAPTVTGHKPLKIAFLLLMAGAPAWRLKDNSRLRGDINLLLCGDSETFKTVFARWLGPVMPRFIYNSGESSSIAGLMATAVYREGVPILEGGAYMMAGNGGVCVLDEIEKYNENDRQRLLEVLEDSQTMTIRKLGIHKTLHARCSTIGIANALAGYWNKDISFEENTGFKRSWYSRFDLIFTLTDEPDRERDSANAQHFLDHYYAGISEEEYEKQRRKQGMHKTKHIKIQSDSLELEYYSSPFMAHWVRHVRSNFKDPILKKGSPADKAILLSYLKIRGFDVDHMSREEINRRIAKIGPRQLAGLIRLSKASARAHMRNEVIEKDARLAVWLIKESIKSSGVNVLPAEETVTTAPVSTLKYNDMNISQRELDKIAKAEHGPRSRFLKILGKVGTTACALCGGRARLYDGAQCDNCTKGKQGTIFSKSTLFAECEAVDVDVRYVDHYWNYCEKEGYLKFKGRGDMYDLTSKGFDFMDRSIAYKELPSLSQPVEKPVHISSKISEEMAKVKVDPTDELLRQDLEENGDDEEPEDEEEA